MEDSRPILRAIILDFSSVNNVDITSVQNLIDVRNQLDRYAAPETVEWHIACINNRWTKRALASAGFGYPVPPSTVHARWKPIFSVADIGGRNSAAWDAEHRDEKAPKHQRAHDVESPKNDVIAVSANLESPSSSALKAAGPRKVVVVHGLNRPFFHTDLTTALQSAVLSVERKQEFEQKGGKGIGEEP
jgi:solute carrier family 26 (sodium-independent sulfate anion transporter), member 11